MPIVMRYTQLLSAIVDYGYKTLLDRVTMSRISDYYGPAQYYCPIILSFIIIHFIYLSSCIPLYFKTLQFMECFQYFSSLLYASYFF